MADPAEDDVLVAAAAAREAGELWRARDLLAAHVEQEADPEALDLLAQVLTEMGDLPRAGSAWFAAGARGPEVDAAVAAWREQSRDDFGVMWRSLPEAVRAAPRPRRVEALRERAGVPEDALEDAPDRRDGATATHAEPEGFDVHWLAAWVLAVAFVVFAVIGFVTVLAWVVPG